MRVGDCRGRGSRAGNAPEVGPENTESLGCANADPTMVAIGESRQGCRAPTSLLAFAVFVASAIRRIDQSVTPCKRLDRVSRQSSAYQLATIACRSGAKRKPMTWCLDRANLTPWIPAQADQGSGSCLDHRCRDNQACIARPDSWRIAVRASTVTHSCRRCQNSARPRLGTQP